MNKIFATKLVWKSDAMICNIILQQQQHPFHGLFSRTTWVSRYQKGRTILDFNEARDDG